MNPKRYRIRLKGVVTAIGLTLFGLMAGLLLTEVVLHLTPDSTWKKWISVSGVRRTLYRADPAVGWVHVPGAHVPVWQGSGEFDIDLRFNSLGQRDRERRYERQTGVSRVLLIGDSFVEANAVTLAHTFGARLEKCLSDRTRRPVEVINAGVSGYGPGDELLLYEHEGVKYRPDVVLVAVYAGNDVKDMQRDGDELINLFGGYRFRMEGERLVARWIDWADSDLGISGIERFMRRHSAIYYMLRSTDSRGRYWLDDHIGLWLSRIGLGWDANDKTADYRTNANVMIFAKGFPDRPAVPQSISELWELFEAGHRELRAQVEAHGSRLGVVVLPALYQVHEELHRQWVVTMGERYDGLDQGWRNWELSAPNEHWDAASPNRAMMTFFESQGIPALDLLPSFRQHDELQSDLLYFPLDVHFNARGHQLAADAMCDWVIESGLVTVE